MKTLEALVDISVLAPHRAMAKTPHGQELLGLKKELAPDVFVAWANQTQKSFKTALLLTPDLSPQLAEDLASTLISAIEGTKSQGASFDELGHAVTSILRVVEAAIVPR